MRREFLTRRLILNLGKRRSNAPFTLNPLLSGKLQKLRSQFWTSAFVVMLEKNVGVFPVLVIDALYPLIETRFQVADASQTQISPVGSFVDVACRQVIRI